MQIWMNTIIERLHSCCAGQPQAELIRDIDLDQGSINVLSVYIAYIELHTCVSIF